MRLHRFIGAAFLGVALSAGAGAADPYQTYLIRQGQNYSNGYSSLFYAASITKTVLFDQSAIYTNKLASNQEDINKLFGFSDCTSPHQTNSARFGWNWDPKQRAVRLFAYNYVKGARQSKYLGNVKFDTPTPLTIRLNKATYEFVFDGKVTSMPRGCNSARAVGYTLQPYFGGDEPAPHDITIRLTR